MMFKKQVTIFGRSTSLAVVLLMLAVLAVGAYLGGNALATGLYTGTTSAISGADMELISVECTMSAPPGTSVCAVIDSVSYSHDINAVNEGSIVNLIPTFTNNGADNAEVCSVTGWDEVNVGLFDDVLGGGSIGKIYTPGQTAALGFQLNFENSGPLQDLATSLSYVFAEEGLCP